MPHSENLLFVSINRLSTKQLASISFWTRFVKKKHLDLAISIPFLLPCPNIFQGFHNYPSGKSRGCGTTLKQVWLT